MTLSKRNFQIILHTYFQFISLNQFIFLNSLNYPFRPYSLFIFYASIPFYIPPLVGLNFIFFILILKSHSEPLLRFLLQKSFEKYTTKTYPKKPELENNLAQNLIQTSFKPSQQRFMISKLCCLSTDSCKGQCIGLSRNQNIKLTYTFFFFILLLTSQLINYRSQQDSVFQQQTQTYDCTNIDFRQIQGYIRYQSSCIAQRKTSLDMFGLSIFHFLIFSLLLSKTKHVKVINEGIWLIKILLIVMLVFLVTFTFGPAISSYLQLGTTLLTPVLYILMNIILIDNIYFLEFKVNTFSEKHKSVHVVKVIFSLLLWAGSIILNVFSYFSNQLWVSISSSVVILVFLVLTFLRISRNNSLFVYAFVMVHVNLIAYSIHIDEEEEENDKFRVLEHGYRIMILVLSVFGMLAQGGNQIRTKKSTINEILALNTSKKEQDNRYVSSNKWIMYHAVMVVIAFSFTAVFNYRYDSSEQTAREFLGIGRVSWWVSAVIVYFWSIVVHKIYPEQDFSELQNYFKEFQLN